VQQAKVSRDFRHKQLLQLLVRSLQQGCAGEHPGSIY
jgi:hypothetical protein